MVRLWLEECGSQGLVSREDVLWQFGVGLVGVVGDEVVECCEGEVGWGFFGVEYQFVVVVYGVSQEGGQVQVVGVVFDFVMVVFQCGDQVSCVGDVGLYQGIWLVLG